MSQRPVFADPKTDLVFKRVFGDEAHKDLLIALLNALLGLDEAHRIVDLTYLPAEQTPAVPGMKNSIVDVKCLDARGTRYLVEMQLLHVEGFEKRIVYNLCKAFTAQLGAGDAYPALGDVVAVTICDFVLWPPQPGETPVPMVSRWSMREEQTGITGLRQLRYAFLELPKYAAGDAPTALVDRWAYYFREARNFKAVPRALAEQPFVGALEAARAAAFTPDEWEAYDRAKIAEQDARGALSLALKEGRQEGLKEGLKEGRKEGRKEGLKEGRKEGLLVALELSCELLGVELTDERRACANALDDAALEQLLAGLRRERRWPE